MSFSLDRRQAARTAWADFVAHVHERHDPNGGWVCVEQLPILAPADLALALTAYPDLMDDVQLDATDLAQVLSTGDVAAAHESLGLSVLCQLSREIRRQLLSDLRDHAEDLEGAAAAAEAECMGMTGEQYGEHIRGVAR